MDVCDPHSWEGIATAIAVVVMLVLKIIKRWMQTRDLVPSTQSPNVAVPPDR